MHVVLLALGLWLTAAAHVFAAPVVPAPYTGPPPLTQIRQDGPWTLFSRDVNRILCAAAQGGETWLGTEFGVKRLDRNGKLLRLYTHADGLPDNAVIALAVEPREAWCVVQRYAVGRVPAGPPPPRKTYFLCRLDRTTDRWETLRQVPLPQTNVIVMDRGDFPTFVAAAAPHTVAFVLGDVAAGAQGIAAFVWNREKRAWVDLPWPPEWRDESRETAFPPPLCALARAGREGADQLLIGTRRGLVRFDAASGRRTTFLSDRCVGGLASAADGAVWAAAHGLKPGGLRLPDQTLHVLQFDPNSGKTPADTLLSPTEDSRRQDDALLQARPRTVVPDENGVVWLVSTPFRGGFNGGGRPPVALRVETRTGGWRPVDLRDEAGRAAPAAVWGAALLADMALPAEDAASHLPGWIGPADISDKDALALTQSLPLNRLADAGAVWSVGFRPGDALTRTDADGAAQTFPLPDAPLPMTLPARAAAVAGRALLALTKSGLWQRPLSGGPWREVVLPKPITYDSRLTAAGDDAWVEVGDAVYRYRPASGEVTPAPAWQGFRALTADGGQVWLTERYSPQTLYRATGPEVAPTRITVSPLPVAAPSEGFLPGSLLGVAAGKAWYVRQEPRFPSERAPTPKRAGGVASYPPTDTLVRGYDLAAKTWTEPLRIAGALPAGFSGPASSLSLCSGPDGAYVAVAQRGFLPPRPAAGDVYRYDAALGHWRSVAPTVPVKTVNGQVWASPPLRLAAAARSVWLVNALTPAVRRWDRVRQTWEEFPSPRHASVFEGGPDGGPTAARDGGAFFVASDSGVWKFRAATRAWESLPMPVSARRGLTLTLQAVDERAVWGLCAGPGQTLAARFDKAKRTWRLWGAADGLPAPADWPSLAFPSFGGFGVPVPGRQIAADGVSALAAVRGGLYRLNPRTDRWDNLTAPLARAVARATPGPKAALLIQRMTWDGANAWLQMAPDGPPGAASPRPPILVRWDRPASGSTPSRRPPPPTSPTSAAWTFWMNRPPSGCWATRACGASPKRRRPGAISRRPPASRSPPWTASGAAPTGRYG